MELEFSLTGFRKILEY